MNIPTIASCSDKLVLHNPSISTPIKTFQPHTGIISCCTWDSHGKYIATGGDDAKIWITNVVKMNPYFYLADDLSPPCSVNSLGFSKNNLFLASGNGDGSIKIWDLKKREKSLEFRGLSAGVTSIAWNIESCLLAGGTILGNICVYNMSTNGKQRFELKQLKYDGVKKLQFSPYKSNLLATSSSNGNVRIWKLQEQDEDEINTNPILTFDNHKKTCSDLAFSPVHESLICSVGYDSKIHFYDLAKGVVAKSFELHTQLSSVAFDHRGTGITVGAVSGELIYMDLNSKSKISLTGHNRKPINSIDTCNIEKVGALYENISSTTSSVRNTYSQQSVNTRKLGGIDAYSREGKISKRSMMDLQRESETSQPSTLGRPPSKSLMGVISKKKLNNYIQEPPSVVARKSSNTSKNYLSEMEYKMNEKMKSYKKEPSVPRGIKSHTNLPPSIHAQKSTKSLHEEQPPQFTSVPQNMNIQALHNIDEGGIADLIDKKLERNNEDMKEFFHEQIQALHLDVIRQFEIQKEFFKSSLMDYADKYNTLQEKYDELLLENEKLKKSAF